MKRYYGRLIALALIGLLNALSACHENLHKGITMLPQHESPNVRLWADHRVRISPGWINFTAFLNGDLAMPQDPKANNWKCLVPSWDFGDYFGAKPSTNIEITCADDMDAEPLRIWHSYHKFDVPGTYEIRFMLVSRTGKKIVSPGHIQVEVKE